MLAHWHATTVVLDDDHAVGADRHVDRRRMAGHRLVDRVVDDLPDEVVETALVRRADVHARPAANGLQPLEDLDARSRVVGAGAAPAAPATGSICAVARDRDAGLRRRLRSRFGHPFPPTSR